MPLQWQCPWQQWAPPWLPLQQTQAMPVLHEVSPSRDTGEQGQVRSAGRVRRRAGAWPEPSPAAPARSGLLKPLSPRLPRSGPWPSPPHNAAACWALSAVGVQWSQCLPPRAITSTTWASFSHLLSTFWMSWKTCCRTTTTCRSERGLRARPQHSCPGEPTPRVPSGREGVAWRVSQHGCIGGRDGVQSLWAHISLGTSSSGRPSPSWPHPDSLPALGPDPRRNCPRSLCPALGGADATKLCQHFCPRLQCRSHHPPMCPPCGSWLGVGQSLAGSQALLLGDVARQDPR